MFELARAQLIGTRKVDFARLALHFTDHTRFLYNICLYSNITCNLTIIVYVRDV